MPFCGQCGNSLTGNDFFCSACGARQPGPGQPGPYRHARGMDNISPRTASMLCYIPFVGWIAAILVLAAARFRDHRDVRFHAFQGLYLFVAWLLVDWVVAPWFRYLPHFFFPVGKVLQLLVLGLWIFMIIKASREEKYSLPVLGELAERSL